MSDARQLQARASQSFRQIKSGGIAFDVRPEGNHNFLNGFRGETFFQFGNAQVIRVDAIQGRNFSTEDVKFAVERAGLFDAQDIHGLLHYSDQGRIAPRVGANLAGGGLSQCAAIGAELNPLPRAHDRFGQLFRIGTVGLHEVQRDAFGGAGANAR